MSWRNLWVLQYYQAYSGSGSELDGWRVACFSTGCWKAAYKSYFWEWGRAVPSQHIGVKFSQEYKPDGIFGIITHPQTQQSAVFRTLAPQHPANQTENQIFFSVFKLGGRRVQSLKSISTSSWRIWSSIRQFSPKPISISTHFRFSRRCDLTTLSQHSRFLMRARVDGAYKQQSQKVQLVDLKLLDGSKPEGSDAWRVNVIKKEIPIFDSIDKYTHWLISKFTPIAKRARLTPEQLTTMIIEDSMWPQKKDIHTQMLYNREVVLPWDFTEIQKFKNEVALAQKIWTIEHKAWQVSGF